MSARSPSIVNRSFAALVTWLATNWAFWSRQARSCSLNGASSVRFTWMSVIGT